MITSEKLFKIGYTEGKAFGLALKFSQNNTGLNEKDVLKILQSVIQNPELPFENIELTAIAEALISRSNELIELEMNPKPHTIFGGDVIEEGAHNQMKVAMQLPIVHSGSLMPDAHQGYGLPIGGVLATNNSVIPFGVGVDIGCRMCLSIYDEPIENLQRKADIFKSILNENTRFGTAVFKNKTDHEVLYRAEFNEIPIVKQLFTKAASQIGSSGGGNHFVEFGIVEVNDTQNSFGVSPGKYIGLLSHSGSRGLGAGIAQYYTKLAMNLCKLPQAAKHLAWLDLNSAEGQEYWLAMNLAGDYASACHHQIHYKVAQSLQSVPIATIENHHNFAWKEKDEFGNEIIVHRKGATPAGKGVLGIIPGSMTAPGFIVKGKGNISSINSASHGAGRLMSRTKAKNTLIKSEVNKFLNDHGVQVIGSGLDEAPQAYKDINEVMSFQSDLVEILGTFTPKIVRMCGDSHFHEVD